MFEQKKTEKIEKLLCIRNCFWLRSASNLNKTKIKMKKKVFAHLWLFLLVCWNLVQATSHPNVILIVTDDQGYGDLGAHGNPILQTPNLDKLHGESIRFSNFHVSPVCTPMRGELMTGLYALRNKAGMVPAGRNLMRKDIVTMPGVFAENGYATGLFGKWHLGDAYPHRPMDRGFQRVVWHKGWGLASEIEYDNDYYYTRYLDEMEVKYSDRFCTNLWFDTAMEWMDGQIDSEQPFFTYIALNTPHSPFHALAKDFAKYGHQVSDSSVAHFFGLIDNIDQNYARLDLWMNERGIHENTLLIFMNDNGTARGEKIFNAGMRGKKGSGYEGGHRGILFVRWPGGKLGNPREVDYASSVTDILPTLADMLDLKIPKTEFPFDGISLKSALYNTDFSKNGRKLIVQFGSRFRPQKFFRSCVIFDHWRLNGKSELYDLSKDPGQEHDVSDKFPELTKALRDYYNEYWDSIEESNTFIESIVVGNDAEPFTDLTCNNWVEVDFDNRNHVAGGESMGGVWQIEADKSGFYRVELARWPFFMKRALTTTGPSTTIGGMPIEEGVALPITSGSLSVDGSQAIQANAHKDNTRIVLEVELSVGRHTLQGWFHDASGKKIAGAFYSRVTKL
tara:strand:+ start:4835 stop:6694 length:1860 start_codon:yes stop_codon:yes gene_type:complete